MDRGSGDAASCTSFAGEGDAGWPLEAVRGPAGISMAGGVTTNALLQAKLSQARASTCLQATGMDAHLCSADLGRTHCCSPTLQPARQYQYAQQSKH